MNRNLTSRELARRAVIAAAALAFSALPAGAAYAQASGDHSTPKGWNYEIKDGKRVPKSTRTTNKDGSWREESKQGACSTVKEGSAKGEVKVTRKCD